VVAIAENAKRWSKAQVDLLLLDHAILKWTGALKVNLKAHGLVRLRHNIYKDRNDSKSVLEYSSDTCGLCLVYDPDFYPSDRQMPCAGCPLRDVLEEPCCAANAPYHDVLRGRKDGLEVVRMVNALKKAKRMVERKLAKGE
jgi:hypothetical protein